MNRFNVLFEKTLQFAKKTFPDCDGNDHIRKLRDEATEVLRDPKDVFEYADCLLALLAGAGKAGISAQALLNTAFVKLSINEQRKWIKQPDGTYQHEDSFDSWLREQYIKKYLKDGKDVIFFGTSGVSFMYITKEALQEEIDFKVKQDLEFAEFWGINKSLLELEDE